MKYPSLRKLFAMPLTFALASFCSISLVPTTAHAAAVTGDPLNIGTDNTFTSCFALGAIGNANVISGSDNSVVVGAGNSITLSSYVFVTGSWNTLNLAASGAAIGDSNNLSGYFNFVSGYWNTISGWVDFVMGEMNELLNTDTNVMAESTALFGKYSHGDNLIACLMAGTENHGDYATDSAAIGQGLILGPGTQSQVVVGQYNVADTNPLLIVGNGTSTGPRSNALVVHRNGDVNISGVLRVPQSGDISMGEFTHVPQ